MEGGSSGGTLTQALALFETVGMPARNLAVVAPTCIQFGRGWRCEVRDVRPPQNPSSKHGATET